MALFFYYPTFAHCSKPAIRTFHFKFIQQFHIQKIGPQMMFFPELNIIFLLTTDAINYKLTPQNITQTEGPNEETTFALCAAD
jgi:hypothetical protein